MIEQFKHYTNRIDLIPFAGQVSIPIKWEIAKRLERFHEKYDKNIIILYYGDYDKHGKQIIESAAKDIRGRRLTSGFTKEHIRKGTDLSCDECGIIFLSDVSENSL